MNKKEKSILRALVEHPNGELSPVDFVNGIAQHDRRAVHNLLAEKYVETTPHPHRDVRGGYYDVHFYRASKKGLAVFQPLHKKAWFYLKGDLRTIIVSLVTALGTTVVAIFVEKALN